MLARQLEHQEELILDVKFVDWNFITRKVLTEFYVGANKEPPEWIDYFNIIFRVRIKRQNYPVTVDSSICWFSTDRKSVSRLTRYV
jgi:hypothetical protein